MRPGKKLREGTRVHFSDKLEGVIKDVRADGNRVVEFR